MSLRPPERRSETTKRADVDQSRRYWGDRITSLAVMPSFPKWQYTPDGRDLEQTNKQKISIPVAASVANRTTP